MAVAEKKVMAHRNMVRKPVTKGRCTWCSKLASENKGKLWRYGSRRQDGTTGWFVGRFCNAKCRDEKRYCIRRFVA